MAEQERRTDWEGSGGLMTNLPYYGLSKEKRLAAVSREHLKMCQMCRKDWDEIWPTLPENKKTDELARIIQRNHR